VGEIKTIGVLTSGGDAPGMNAAIRAVTRTAISSGIKVKGIYEGYKGLLENTPESIRDLDRRSVSLILGRGGTFLRSSRCDEFKLPEKVKEAADICRQNGIDGIVALGGDGTFRGARDLSKAGIPCIGIPCTIDNDIGCTDYCIGFDTAVNTVTENIDKLRDTTASHYRCSVVVVMGRNCGDIALHSAINCGAVSVLVPEKEINIERNVIERMHITLHSGKSHFIVIVAEGVIDEDSDAEHKLKMNAFELAKYIQKETGVESRATVVGHVQRGGSPTSRDRVLAAQMGHYAVTLLQSGKSDRVVAIRNEIITDFDIKTALNQKKLVNMDLEKIANQISIWDIVK
jgi:6-phosphofructokinase 1